MYLKTLDEEQKSLFLDLAYYLANCDGNYSEDEKNLMKAYCQEMQIPYDAKRSILALDKLMVTLSAIDSERVKKILVFESIGLAKVDGNYDENERKLIEQVREVFGLSKDFLTACERLIDEYVFLQENINEIILG